MTQIRASTMRSFGAEDSVSLAVVCDIDHAGGDCTVIVRNSSTASIRFPMDLRPYFAPQYEHPNLQVDADEYAIRRRFDGSERDTVLLGPNQSHEQRMHFNAYEPPGDYRVRLTLCAPHSQFEDMFKKWQTTPWQTVAGADRQ
jgi:hypothetical protein